MYRIASFNQINSQFFCAVASGELFLAFVVRG
jgi:hypothetical protein